MSKQKRQTFCLISTVVLGMFVAMPIKLMAAQLSIYYGGRLTKPSGAPVKGPVALQASFFHTETGGVAIGGIVVNFNNIGLTDGIFQIDISLSDEEWTQIFPSVSQKVYIQLENVTESELYPRQLYNVAPYALKVPVDNQTITYNDKGQLSLGAGLKLQAGTTGNYVEVLADPTSADGTKYTLPAAPIANKFLTTDGSGIMAWIDLPGGGSISGVTAGTGLAGGGASGSVTLNVDVGTTANKIIQLDGTGKLPAVDGSALTNIVAATITSQGSLATLNAVSGGVAGTITDDSILNTDVNAAAAIATSKLSGPISAIASNGLGTAAVLNVGLGSNNIPQLDFLGKLPAVDGSNLTNVSALSAGTITSQGTLATANAVGGGAGGTITDDSITNADVNFAAAITTSKLSGPISAITGNGLGTAAVLNVGVGSNNIPQLDFLGKLPAVDGSNLTNVTAASAGSITGQGTLATANAVGGGAGGTITDDSITNADVNSAAAIATSKLSGPISAITGNGLGTAATQNVGVAAGNVVQLNGSGMLPAVDGSQLTNLPTSATNWAVPGTIGSTTPNSGSFTTLSADEVVISATVPGGIPLAIAGASGQTAALAEFRNDTGTVLSRIKNDGSIALKDGDTNYATIRANNAMPADIVFTLPPDGAIAGQFLTSDSSGNLNWGTPSGSGNMSTSTFDANTDGMIDLAAGGTGASTAGGARAALGLGTAAMANTGTASGNVPVLGVGGALPVVSGVNLTNLDAGNISAGTLPLARGGTGGTDAASSRTSLGLGTAALTNTGTTSGNVPVLSAGGALPAVSGVNLTNLDAGNISAGTLPLTRGGTGGTDAASARTSLGLGTAALLTAGTSPNNVVQLDGTSRLPAVDGSQLTGIAASSLGTLTSNITFDGTGARSLFVNRPSTADTAGNNLTVYAGGATSGATDKAGGDLVLASGIATGSGNSAISFQTATSGSPGTTDQSPTTKMTILGNGNVGIGTTAPTNALHVKDNMGIKSETTSTTFGTSFFTGRSGSVDAFSISYGGMNEVKFITTDTVDNDNGSYFIQKNGESFGRAVFSRGHLGFGPGSTTRDTYIKRDSGDLTFEFGTTPAEKMRITSSGNVGIGTINPQSGLDVAVASGIRAYQICDEAGANCKDLSTGWGGTGDMLGASNLSDLANTTTARSNLGLGNSATLAVGTGAGTVAAGDHAHADATTTVAGFLSASDKTKLDGIAAGAGVVNTANVAAANAAMDSDFASQGIMLRGAFAGTYSILTDNSTDWNTAFTDRNKWDGGATGLNATTGRASLSLGTAATLNVGTSPNNVVQLDGTSRLPAVDGSQLTGIAASTLGTLTSNIDFNGTAARSVSVNRPSTADTAGNSLTVNSGGATSGATNKAGGDLVLASGTATGSGSSAISFQTATAGSSGTADAAATTKMTILGNGNVGIGTGTPTSKLDVAGGDFSVANGDISVTSPNAYIYSFSNSTSQYSAGHIVLAHDQVIPTHQRYDIMVQKSSAGAATGTSTFEIRRRNSSGSEVMTPFVITDAGDVALQAGYTNGSQALGKVGIGTTSPQAPLSVTSTRDAIADTGNPLNYHVYIHNPGSANGTGPGIAFAESGVDANVGAAITFKRTGTESQGELQFYTKQSTTGAADPIQAMVISNTGKVGIGATVPEVALDVQGQIRSRVNADTDLNIDWSLGNTQYTTASCGATTFTNMLDGGSYTLIVQGATPGTCTFVQDMIGTIDDLAIGDFKFSPVNGATDASTHTVYTFIRAATRVYVSWIKGFTP